MRTRPTAVLLLAAVLLIGSPGCSKPVTPVVNSAEEGASINPPGSRANIDKRAREFVDEGASVTPPESRAGLDRRVWEFVDEPASVTPLLSGADLATWAGHWESSQNGLFQGMYIRLEFSSEKQSLRGVLMKRELETVRFFPLSDIKANADRLEFSYNRPKSSIIVGGLGDQLVGRLQDGYEEWPKMLSRLVRNGPDMATQRIFRDGSWSGVQGDYPLFKRRKS